MKATEAVRQVMESTGTTLSTLSRRLGKRPQVVWDRLSQDNISVAKLNEMLRTMDYKVVIVPSGVRMGNDAWIEIE